MKMNEMIFNMDNIIENLIITVIYVAFILLIRYALLQLISSWKIRKQDERRKWIVQIRYISIFIIFLGLIIIWAAQIRTLAFSIVAFAVALVLAFKETLANPIGSLVKSSNRLFDVGDRIEINGIRGDVIDHTFFCTTVYEVSSSHNIQKYTGRIVKIPNAFFLSHSVFNETTSSPYFLHTIRLPIANTDNWQRAESILLNAAREETKEFLDDAKKYLKRLEDKEGIVAPDLAPQVFIDVSDKDVVELHLRTPLRYDLKGIIEQNIIRKFASEFYEKESAN